MEVDLGQDTTLKISWDEPSMARKIRPCHVKAWRQYSTQKWPTLGVWLIGLRPVI